VDVRWQANGLVLLYRELQIVGLEDTNVGDNTGDQARRCYIEGRVPTIDILRCDSLAVYVGHFLHGSFLDNHLVTAQDRQIDGRLRCGHVEGDLVILGEDRDLQSIRIIIVNARDILDANQSFISATLLSCVAASVNTRERVPGKSQSCSRCHRWRRLCRRLRSPP